MFKLYPKATLLLLFVSISGILFSQNIGINTSGATPSTNAILDLNSGNLRNLGLIIPNVSLSAPATFDPPIANANTIKDVGMMVYNTNAAFSSGVGYYYWSGVAWVSVGGAGGSGNVSACGTAAAGYIPYFTSGTTICNSVIYQASTTAVGVGTTAPKNMLDVNGAMATGTYAGTVTAPTNGMAINGQVGIGTNTPDPSSMLDVYSTTQGLLPPSMATLPVSPVNGLIVYNTTTNCLEYYVNTLWVNISCGCSTGPSPVGTITATPSTTVCPTNTFTCSIATVPGAATYSWSSSNTSIVSLTSANGLTSATFTAGATAGSFTITVTATNPCGSTLNTITGYNGVTTATPTVVGNTTPTTSTAYTYTCAPVTGATGYTWSTSNTSYGTVTASASNSCTVTTTATAGTFNVCVTPTNACGSGTQGCLSVTSTACPGTIVVDGSAVTAAKNVNTLSITTSGTNEIVVICVDGFVLANRAFSGSVTVTGGSASGLTQLINTQNYTATYGYSENQAVYAFVAGTAATYNITVTEANLSGMKYYDNSAVALKGFCNTATIASNVVTGTAVEYTSSGSSVNTLSNSSLSPAVAGSYIVSNFCTWEYYDQGTVSWTAPAGISTLGSIYNSTGGMDFSYGGYSDAATGNVTVTLTDIATGGYAGDPNIALGTLQVVDVHN